MQTAGAICRCLQFTEAGMPHHPWLSLTQYIPALTLYLIWDRRTSPPSKQRAIALLEALKASLYCNKRRCRLEIVPAVQCYTWYSDCEWDRNSFMCHRKWLCSPSSKTPRKYSSYHAESHTPMCRGLPQFDLSRQERGHTLLTLL